LVETATYHPEWIGAGSYDNIAAELSAALIAQRVALRKPFSFAPDLTLGARIAEGCWKCKTYHKLAQILHWTGQISCQWGSIP